VPSIRRSSSEKRKAKVALVCAGGGVTGAVYEIGCLRALDELLGRSVLDLDLYVGISGGAFVASILAAGVSPREMYDEATKRTHTPLGVSAAPLYRLGTLEFLRRSSRAPGVLSRALVTSLTGEGRNLSDLAWSFFELLPPGLMETAGIQEYLHRVFLSRLGSDSFRDFHRDLNVVAVDLDNGEAVAFGRDRWRDVPVSKAVQASAAMPGLYRPVRIGGRDYIDGGVKKTAHINLAIQSGADLVICINPIVPYLNDTAGGPLRGHLSNRGVTWVLDQAMRIMLHGRMQYGLERYRREHPEVDILLIEPTRDDVRMFGYNIMRYSARRVVAEHGYRTALAYFRRHAGRYRRLFAKHGIAMADPRRVPDVPSRHPHQSDLARSLDSSLERLESRLGSRPSRTRPSGGARGGRRPSAGSWSGPPPRSG
jgi:predicted acylesterase/phospholipase RssA